MIKTLKYLAHRRARPQRYRFLKPLLVHETLNAAQLQAFHQQRFSDMVHYAHEHTVFYRRHYAHQLPADIDATTLPMIITADAQAAHQAVVRAMDAAGQMGFVHLSITTRQPPQPAESPGGS